jgi:hypothetical protein
MRSTATPFITPCITEAIPLKRGVFFKDPLPPFFKGELEAKQHFFISIDVILL